MIVTNFRAAIEEAEKTGKQTATVDLEELKVATRRLADLYGGVDLRQVEVQTEEMKKAYNRLVKEVDSIKDLDKLEMYKKHYRRWLAASDLIKKLALEIDRIEHGGD